MYAIYISVPHKSSPQEHYYVKPRIRKRIRDQTPDQQMGNTIKQSSKKNPAQPDPGALRVPGMPKCTQAVKLTHKKRSRKEGTQREFPETLKAQSLAAAYDFLAAPHGSRFCNFPRPWPRPWQHAVVIGIRPSSRPPRTKAEGKRRPGEGIDKPTKTPDSRTPNAKSAMHAVCMQCLSFWVRV